MEGLCPPVKAPARGWSPGPPAGIQGCPIGHIFYWYNVLYNQIKLNLQYRTHKMWLYVYMCHLWQFYVDLLNLLKYTQMACVLVYVVSKHQILCLEYRGALSNKLWQALVMYIQPLFKPYQVRLYRLLGIFYVPDLLRHHRQWKGYRSVGYHQFRGM